MSTVNAMTATERTMSQMVVGALTWAVLGLNPLGGAIHGVLSVVSSEGVNRLNSKCQEYGPQWLQTAWNLSKRAAYAISFVGSFYLACILSGVALTFEVFAGMYIVSAALQGLVTLVVKKVADLAQPQFQPW